MLQQQRKVEKYRSLFLYLCLTCYFVGYKQLLLHDKVLNALSFKAFLQKELGLTSDNTKTLQEIKELK